MSPVSLHIIKYKTIHVLANLVIAAAVFMAGKYVLITLDIVNVILPGMVLVFWFSLEYAKQSAATEFYILPEYESQVRQILENEGLKLKTQDDHRWLYHKSSRFDRNDFVVITRKETYFTVKGSTDFSPKLEPYISDDMLYGKRKRLVFSRLNESK